MVFEPSSMVVPWEGIYIVRVSDMAESHGIGGGSPPTEDTEVVNGPGADPLDPDATCEADPEPGVGSKGGRGSPVDADDCSDSRGFDNVGRDDVADPPSPAVVSATVLISATAATEAASRPPLLALLLDCTLMAVIGVTMVVVSTMCSWGGISQGHQAAHPGVAPLSERLLVVTVTVTVTSGLVATSSRGRVSVGVLAGP